MIPRVKNLKVTLIKTTIPKAPTTQRITVKRQRTPLMPAIPKVKLFSIPKSFKVYTTDDNLQDDKLKDDKSKNTSGDKTKDNNSNVGHSESDKPKGDTDKSDNPKS